MARIPLTIAGSDPTGGAGIEADLKVFLAHGLSGAALITALTTQDTRGVVAVAVAPGFRRRMEVLLDDVEIAGVKTGLLPNGGSVRTVAAGLTGRPCPYLVVDPIVSPTSGRPFLDESGQRALRDRLLPRATLVTPNLDEAAALLGTSRRWIARFPDRATAAIRSTGVAAVLLKGGHGRGQVARDYLDDGDSLIEISLPRIGGRAGRVHGTGCALSAAILVNLVNGLAMLPAVEEAKTWLHAGIQRARRVGKGFPQLDYGLA